MKFAGTKAMTQKWRGEICNLLSSKKYFIKATKSRENFSVIHFSVIVLLKKLVPLVWQPALQHFRGNLFSRWHRIRNGTRFQRNDNFSLCQSGYKLNPTKTLCIDTRQNNGLA
jgi:hypothetical protein